MRPHRPCPRKVDSMSAQSMHDSTPPWVLLALGLLLVGLACWLYFWRIAVRRAEANQSRQALKQARQGADTLLSGLAKEVATDPQFSAYADSVAELRQLLNNAGTLAEVEAASRKIEELHLQLNPVTTATAEVHAEPPEAPEG